MILVKSPAVEKDGNLNNYAIADAKINIANNDDLKTGEEKLKSINGE